MNFLDSAFSRRQQLLLFISFLVIVIASSFLYFFVNYMQVRFEPKTGTTISLSDQAGESSVNSTVIDKQSSRWMRKGSYVVTYGGSDYSTVVKSVWITSSTTLTTPALDFSNTKLKSTLSKERAVIITELQPKLPSGYNVATTQLYKDGSWVGLVLKPTDPTRDVLRVIGHKTGSSWQVAAGPKIIFSKAENPEIPTVVVEGVDVQSSYIN